MQPGAGGEYTYVVLGVYSWSPQRGQELFRQRYHTILCRLADNLTAAPLKSAPVRTTRQGWPLCKNVPVSTARQNAQLSSATDHIVYAEETVTQCVLKHRATHYIYSPSACSKYSGGRHRSIEMSHIGRTAITKHTYEFMKVLATAAMTRLSVKAITPAFQRVGLVLGH